MSRETNEKSTITHTEIEALEDETLEDMTEVEEGGVHPFGSARMPVVISDQADVVSPQRRDVPAL